MNNKVVDKLMLFLGLFIAILYTDLAIAGSSVVAGEYIIKMKSYVSPDAHQNQKFEGNSAAAQKGFALVSSLGKTVRVLQTMPETGMLHLYSMDSKKIAFIKSNPDVEFIEPNYRIKSDPSMVNEMAVPPSGSDTFVQNYSAVQVTNAWAIAKAYNNATAKTIVAVVDTGLDINHGVFKDSNGLWINSAEANGSPGVDDDGNGYIDDINGYNFIGKNANVMDDNEHGSHVAGIILGVGESITANPIRESRITIMPLKFLDSTGSGSTSDAISAITYAVNNGAKVINNSWGGSAYSRSLHEAYTYAYNHNVVVVSAAGNDTKNLDTAPTYPAALDTPSNITVASTTDSDNLSSFSNYSSAGLVHLSAPGSSILSAVPANGLTCSYPGCFKYLSGTSMAAPFVAGVAALVIREAPQLSAYQVKGLILGAIDYKSNLSGKVQTSGRVNVLKSIQAAVSNVGTSYWTPAYSPAYKVETRSVASDSGAAASGCGLVQAFGDSAGPGAGQNSGGLMKFIVILIMMSVPVLLAVKLRVKKTSYVRQHSRFNVEKVMQIKLNNQIVNLVSNTVSVGGFSFSKEMQIDRGQKIKVKLASHTEEIDAEIVWSTTNNSYGVKFSDITDAVKREIESWTQGLVPTS